MRLRTTLLALAAASAMACSLGATVAQAAPWHGVVTVHAQYVAGTPGVNSYAETQDLTYVSGADGVVSGSGHVHIVSAASTVECGTVQDFLIDTVLPAGNKDTNGTPYPGPDVEVQSYVPSAGSEGFVLFPDGNHYVYGSTEQDQTVCIPASMGVPAHPRTDHTQMVGVANSICTGRQLTGDYTNATAIRGSLPCTQPSTTGSVTFSLTTGADRDNDGFPDTGDRCPDTFANPDSTNGCPPGPDRDGDGFPDAIDRCPDAPATAGSADGCPYHPACADGVNNNADGAIDYPADRGCESASDQTEGVDYSLAGVCGLVKGTKDPRCYVLMGAPLVRAIKNHERQIGSVIGLVSHKAIADAAGRAYLKRKIRRRVNRFITYALRRLSPVAAAGFQGFNLGTLLGRITTVAIIAQRWTDLERPGYPHKCFLTQVSYRNKKPALAIDPIQSFVRSWDYANPPSYRPLTTSMARWEAPGDVNATLPLFCKGASASAVTLRSSSGLDELLDPPYVRFSIDFNR